MQRKEKEGKRQRASSAKLPKKEQNGVIEPGAMCAIFLNPGERGSATGSPCALSRKEEKRRTVTAR